MADGGLGQEDIEPVPQGSGVSAALKPKVEIRIAGPLPADVMVTLTKLIGAAWPDAAMVNSSGSAAVFLVEPVQGLDLDEGKLREALTPAGPGSPLAINSVGPEGICAAAPIDVAQALVPVIKAAFEEFPDAENYLEFGFTDPVSRDRYVLLFCRSARQTPHALRLQAEAKLLSARSDAHRESAAAVQHLLGTPVNGPSNTFEAGVKAALESMRALSPGADQDLD